MQVEHVVREEKMMAAYDLVEIYCELIAARLPMIESQKYLKLTRIIFSALYFLYIIKFMSLNMPIVSKSECIMSVLEGVSSFLFSFL